MNNGGDAAEQIVRLSLEGFEVAAKITGEAVKDIALLLISVLKQEQKTKGKARLTNMIKSGKELKVFSVEQKDLKKFTQEAKKYGVLYTVLRDKSNKNKNAEVDIIARAEDASKIQRIVERFELGTVDKAEIVTQAEKNIEKRKSDDNEPPAPTENTDAILDAIFADNTEVSSEETSTQSVPEKETPIKADADFLFNAISQEPVPKETDYVNPSSAKTEKSPPSELYSDKEGMSTDKGTVKESDKPSVHEQLEGYKVQMKKQKETVSISKEADEKTKADLKPAVTEHQQPKITVKKSTLQKEK